MQCDCSREIIATLAHDNYDALMSALDLICFLDPALQCCRRSIVQHASFTSLLSLLLNPKPRHFPLLVFENVRNKAANAIGCLCCSTSLPNVEPLESNFNDLGDDDDDFDTDDAEITLPVQSYSSLSSSSFSSPLPSIPTLIYARANDALILALLDMLPSADSDHFLAKHSSAETSYRQADTLYALSWLLLNQVSAREHSAGLLLWKL